MSIRITYVLASAPCDYQTRTFCGWDRADCHRLIAEWERTLGAELVEWHQTYKH